MKIKLGVKVRDKVSGFEGIAGSRVEYMNGCIRYEVIPKVDKDGKHVDAYYFDEARLEVVKDGKQVKVERKSTGGYQDDPPRS